MTLKIFRVTSAVRQYSPPNAEGRPLARPPARPPAVHVSIRRGQQHEQ